MNDYLMSTVEAYQKICATATGKRAALKTVATPFVEEDQLAARANAPYAQGPCLLCKWREHTFPDEKKCRCECYADIKKEKQRSNDFVGSALLRIMTETNHLRTKECYMQLLAQSL